MIRKNIKKYIIFFCISIFIPSLVQSDTCISKYKPASKELLSFIDKYIGLEIFLDDEKIIRKHDLVSRVCKGSRFGKSDSYCKKGLNIIYPSGGGAVSIDNGLHTISYHGHAIHIGKALDGHYYANDVKNAVEKLLPGVYSQRAINSNDSFLTNEGERLYRYKENYFSMSGIIYGMAGEKRGKDFPYTYIDFEVRDDSFELNRCLKKEAIRNKGKNLTL